MKIFEYLFSSSFKVRDGYVISTAFYMDLSSFMNRVDRCLLLSGPLLKFVNRLPRYSDDATALSYELKYATQEVIR